MSEETNYNDINDDGREIGEIIEMEEEVLKDNAILAKRNNDLLNKHGIKSIEIVGSIGSGKTTILEKLAELYTKENNPKKMYVINGDITTSIDADRIQKHGAITYQINTGRQCALTSYNINQIINETIPDINDVGILYIENVGNLICPSDFILGADMRIMVISVPEGDHVVIKHPLLVKMSEILIINKIDLVDILGTNLQRMIDDAKSINPNITVIPVSCKTGENLNLLTKSLHM